MLQKKNKKSIMWILELPLYGMRLAWT